MSHPPLFTVADSQSLRGQIAGGHTKNLFLKDKPGSLFLVVADEDARIDLKSIHPRIGAKRVSFGSAELLQQHLGVLPGSVTPFAAINDTGRRRIGGPGCRHDAACDAEFSSVDQYDDHLDRGA